MPAGARQFNEIVFRASFGFSCQSERQFVCSMDSEKIYVWKSKAVKNISVLLNTTHYPKLNIQQD